MSNNLIIHDNCHFIKYISEDSIKERIVEISSEMNIKYFKKKPFIICVLNGAVYFTMDLIKYFDFNYKIDFIKIKSYVDMNRGEISSETFNFKNLINEDVIIIEDIIDSGKTLEFLVKEMELFKFRSLSIVTLLKRKNINKINNKDIDWYGFEIKDKYVIGYGLDINNLFRNLKDIYIKDE